jgi:hypothetical protein
MTLADDPLRWARLVQQVALVGLQRLEAGDQRTEVVTRRLAPRRLLEVGLEQ